LLESVGLAEEKSIKSTTPAIIKCSLLDTRPKPIAVTPPIDRASNTVAVAFHLTVLSCSLNVLFGTASVKTMQLLRVIKTET